MNITVARGEIQKRREQALVVNLFEGVGQPGGATGAVDREIGGLIGRAIADGDFGGKKNETLLLYTHGRIQAPRVLVVGLGKKESFDPEAARQAAGTAAGNLQKLGVEKAATILHGAGEAGLDVEEAAQAVAEASTLACYRFDQYRSRKRKASRLRSLAIVEFDQSKLAAARRGTRAGRAIAAAASLARDLANHPGNTATPTYLASAARRIARSRSLRCQVIDETGMRRLGMGALLGVTRGSSEPARFIVLEHNAAREGNPLVFVGKGVTFDSGGISLKPGDRMADMKFDMSGAAAVIGAMQAVSDLDLPHRIVGLVPATENLPGGRAVKPGDVLKTISGKTIEIDNTDAEGRLILADALGYARRLKPAAIVDLATLTGACVVALGSHAAGMLGNDEELKERVLKAGDETGERVWPLPLWPEYRDQIKSAVADMKNTGGRAGGAITAASLLEEFVDSPWVHLDIAGTAWTTRAKPYIPKGGVGFGVRLLTRLARDWKRAV